MVAKVEFHPYDELLWVYDTRNDGDGVYVEPCAGDIRHCDSLGFYGAPGTSDPIDHRVVNFDLAEGTLVHIWGIFDNADGTGFITSEEGGRA
jgi:hypothetical protein